MPDYAINIRLQGQDNVSPQMRNVNREIDDLDDKAKKSGMGLGSLDKAMQNVATVMGGLFFVQKAGELLELGKAAERADNTFTQLAGGGAAAAATLNALRAATSGVVDDMTLMAGANKMMVTGLATSANDVAKLTELGVKLSSAMGVGAAEGLDNFVAAMNNMSFERLDTLGISASKVRERVAELKQEGLDTQEAFKLATMEEGAKTLDRLGDSIDANISSMDKLQVRLQNGIQDFAQWASEGVEKAATSLDQLVQIIGMVGEHGLGTVIQAANDPASIAANSRAASLADRGVEAYDEFMSMAGLNSVMTGEQLQDQLTRAFEMIENDPELRGNWEKVVSTLIDAPFDPESPAMVGLRDALSATYDMVTKEAGIDAANAARTVLMQQQEIARFNVTMATGDAMRQRQSAALNARYTQFYGGGAGSSFNDPWGGVTGFFAPRENVDMSGVQQVFQDAQYARDKLGEFGIDTQSIGKFMRPEEAAIIRQEFEELRALADEGFINDDELSKAQGLADEAERAAKAFTDMSLTDIFGQTSGGMKGEIGDMVMGVLKDAGLDESQLSGIQRTFDLGSGRETDVSLVMQEKVAPMIAELAKTDPVLAQQAIDNLNKFLEQAALMDMSPEQMANMLPGATGFMTGGAGGTFTVNPGDTLSGLAAQYGYSVPAMMGAAGITNPAMLQPGTYNFGGGYAPIPGFDPAGFAGSNFAPALPGAGGAPVNPLNASGFWNTPLLNNFDGQAVGSIDPYQKQKEDTEIIADNIVQMTDNALLFRDELEVVNEKMDLIAEPRQATITLRVDDQTGGILAQLIGGLTITPNGSGRSPVPPGDPRVGGRPGSPRPNR